MYLSVYGLRVLGMFANEVDAINYNAYIQDNDNRYPNIGAFDVRQVEWLPKVEFLDDLEGVIK